MADNATQGQKMLRRIAMHQVNVSVFQHGDQFEVEATGKGQTIHLKGPNLLTLAKDVAKRLGVDPASRAR